MAARSREATRDDRGGGAPRDNPPVYHPTYPGEPDPNNPNLPGQQNPPQSGPQAQPPPAPKPPPSLWPDAFGEPNAPTPWLPLFDPSQFPQVSPHAISAPHISGSSYNPLLIDPTSYEAAMITPSSYSPTTVEAPGTPLFTLGPSQFENLSVDPTGRQAQLQMLAEMQRAYGMGGLDEISRAQIEDVLLSQRHAQTSASAGAWQEAQRRGLGTSATALAASLFSSQQAAQTSAVQAQQVASLAEQRRNTLRGDIAGLGGNIRQQDYTASADRARAVDAINRFNIENKQQWVEAAATREMSARTFNAGAINQSNQANAQMSQSANEANAREYNTAARFGAGQAQTAAAFNAGEQNTATRFAAQTAFDANSANTQRDFLAAQHNSSQSFAAEEYNSNRAWDLAQSNKNIDQYNQQQKDEDYWRTRYDTENQYRWRAQNYDVDPMNKGAGTGVPGAFTPVQPPAFH
jgi:hypothetical protein